MERKQFGQNFTFLLLSLSALCINAQSIRFTGSGVYDKDRVKISIDNPHKPIDVAFDFTIEFWMKAAPNTNNAPACNGSSWYYGNILIDRDVFGPGDYGDYGIAICNRKLIFGIERLSGGSIGLVSSTNVDDNTWKHVAITRQSSNGRIRMYINGNLESFLNSSYATGDISYADNRSSDYPNSDPFLVMGGEKHDYPGSLYYNGLIDELRISDTIRYNANFTPIATPFVTDAYTVGLFHFDEANDTIVYDESQHLGGVANGIIKRENINAAPYFSFDTPLSCNGTITNNHDSGLYSLRDLIACTQSGSTLYFASSSTLNPIQIIGSTITINKDIDLINLAETPIMININHDDPFLMIEEGIKVTLQNIILNRVSGSSAPLLINNEGTLILNNVVVQK
jgi:hypothetical protein